MLLTFLVEYSWVVATILILTVTGGFILTPFYDGQKNYLMAAPLAGILILSLGTAALYIILGLSLKTSSLLTILMCSGATLITLFFCPPRFNKSELPNLIIVFVVIAIITYISEYATIASGNPSLFFKGAIDTPFYANVADWLNTHLASSPPQKDSGEIYQLWPATLFQVDIRFGAYFILGFFSALRNQPALFSYDFACAVILSAAIISVSSVFIRRSSLAFIFLFLGLLVSDWYDYGRSGFLGKLLIYPSVLYIMGIFFYMKKPVTPRKFFSLIILTYAAANIYPAYAVSTFLFSVGAIFIAIPLLNPKTLRDKIYLVDQLDNVILFCIVVFFPIVSMGILSKISVFGDLMKSYLPQNSSLHNSYYLQVNFARIFHLEHFDFKIKLASHWMLLGTGLFAVATFAALTISIIKKNYIAFCLLVTPILMMIVFIAFKRYWVEYQFIGIFYPLFICGFATLLDSFETIKNAQHYKIDYIICFIAISTLVVIHLPRFVWTSYVYSSEHAGQIYKFEKSEFDELERAIDKSAVTIDIKNPAFSAPLLTELGRRKTHLQFTSESWDATIGNYLDHIKNPKILPSNLHLAMLGEHINKNKCSIKYKTHQYQLVSCNY